MGEKLFANGSSKRQIMKAIVVLNRQLREKANAAEKTAATHATVGGLPRTNKRPMLAKNTQTTKHKNKQLTETYFHTAPVKAKQRKACNASW